MKRVDSHLWLRDSGMISVFLAGILLLTTMAMAGLLDFARVLEARADMRSGLKTASNVILSDFYKPLAHEFGVFAHDEEDVESEAQRLMDARWRETTQQGGDSLYRVTAPVVSVSPLPEAKLSRPQVLEAQIVQFMDWQLPGVSLTRALQHLNLLSQLSLAVEPLEQKNRYEAQLQGVQEHMNDAHHQLEELNNSPLPNALNLGVQEGDEEGEIPIFEGIPALSSALSDIDQKAQSLDGVLAQKLENAYVMSEGDSNGRVALSLRDREDLQKAFQELQDAHGAVGSYLDGLAVKLGQSQTALKNLSESIGELDFVASDWKGAIDAMPEGQLSQTLLGDFLAETATHGTEGMDALGTEMKSLGETTKQVSEGWKKMYVDDKSLSELTFAEWLEARLNSIKVEETSFTFSATEVDHKEAETYRSGVPLSENSLQTQHTIHRQAQTDRSGLLEFISAWAKKQKAIANARHAEQVGLPQFTGGIGDFISSEVLLQYHADASPMPREVMAPVLVSDDETMVGEVLSQLDSLSDSLQKLSLFSIHEQVTLVTYWMGMFSHRLTPHDDALRDPLLSLNGLPLSDRPLYGAELEFILHGRMNWIDNLQQTASRIAAMRLMANLVAAFSSTALYAETSEVALAIAGWTGFAVPWVQSALLTLLAVGETHLDMQALLNGESVDMLKTESTWRFSLAGIRNLAHTVTSDVLDYVEDEALAGVEAGGEVFSESMEKIREQALDSARDAFERPILSFLQGLLTGSGESSVAELQAQIQKAMTALQARSGDSALSSAVSSAYGELSAQSGTMAEAVWSAQQLKKEQGDHTTEACHQLKEALSSLFASVGGGIEDVVDEEMADLSEGISSLKTSAQHDIDQRLDAFFGRFHTQWGSTGDVPAASSGLKMDYGDYVLLFLIMYSATPEAREAMLSQTAQLMQAETQSPDLTQAPTAFTWTLEGDVSTTFLHAFDAERERSLSLNEKWVEGYGAHATDDGGS